jgi:mono/diheme cytochrome c family protein
MSKVLQFLVAAAVSTAMANTAVAQTRGDKVDFGKREFESNCASCHGLNGKGGGPVTEFLTKSPPDLTQLARKNGGVFPIARLYEVIEGAEVPAHGGREMPVWGRDYRTKAAEYYMDVPYDSEAYVRTRLLALLEYLNRMQAR